MGGMPRSAALMLIFGTICVLILVNPVLGLIPVAPQRQEVCRRTLKPFVGHNIMGTRLLGDPGCRATVCNLGVWQDDLPKPEEVMASGVQQTVECLTQSELPLWNLIRFEASLVARSDPKAASMLYESVLSHETFPDALSHNVASRLATTFLSAVQIREFILEMFADQPRLRGVVGSDILAAALRDPAVPNLLTAFLFSKGLHAAFVHRVAHYLHRRGRRDLALFFQSRNSQIFHADIHPAATIGRGIYLGKGTNIVIGETAVLGRDCTVCERVTLGGTGKVRGDRHPKLEDRVTVGVGATILGNIVIGEGSIITAESVLLKPVPPYTRSSGVPAKVVADISCAVDLVESNFPKRSFYVTNIAPGVGI